MNSNFRSEQHISRLAGFLLLFAMASGIFGESVVRGSLLVRGDSERTVENILDSERFYRLGMAADVATFLSVLILIWALHSLLKHVDSRLALLALLLRLVEVGVHVVAVVFTMSALTLINSAESLPGFTCEQIEGLSILALRSQGFAMNLGFIFLGVGSSVYAYLFLRSGSIPKAIAVWGVLASLAMVAICFVCIVFPEARAYQLPAMAPMFVYEIALGAWLLLRGVRSPSAAMQ